MDTSIDQIHTKIEKRRVKLEQIIDRINDDQIREDFDNLFVDYDNKTVHIFIDRGIKEEMNREYIEIVDQINISSKIQHIYRMIKKKHKNNEQIAKLLTECQSPINISVDCKIDYMRCPSCGSVLNTLPCQSELRCTDCGETEILKGTAFEEQSTMDPNIQKRSDYDPTRHSDLWIDRISGTRKVDFDPEIINIIKTKVIEDGIKNKESIKCEYIRSVWKKNGYTKWNDDAPYARFLITKCLPPPLSTKDRKRIRTEVIICMKIFDDIKGPERSNALYYPYVLYKLICIFFKNRPEIKLLDSIHIQNDETLVYNDQNWREICKRRNRAEGKDILPYEPTVVLESLY